jgi:hypothetical protein
MQHDTSLLVRQALNGYNLSHGEHNIRVPCTFIAAVGAKKTLIGAESYLLENSTHVNGKLMSLRFIERHTTVDRLSLIGSMPL